MGLDVTAVEELAVGLFQQQQNQSRDNRFLRASSIGDCRRKLAYRIQWAKEGRPELPIWAHGLSIFEMGHGLHLQLLQRLSNAGMGWIDAEPSVPEIGNLFGWTGNCEINLVDNEYRIAGHCDGLSRPLIRYTKTVDGQEIEFLQPAWNEETLHEGKRYIIDLKTITARERDGKPSAFEKLVAAKPEHIQQASLYAWMTTRPTFRTDRISGPLPEMPGIMIIYIAKDLPFDYYEKQGYDEPRGLLNAPYKVFTRSVNTRTINHMLRKVQGIWEHLDAGTLPPRDYHYSENWPDWHCADCSFRAECYKEEKFFENSLPVIPPRLNCRNVT